MSQSILSDPARDGCFHRTLYEDDREGSVICTECGLVLEPVYIHSSFSPQGQEDDFRVDKKKTEEENLLYDIAQLWHITEREINDIIFYFKTIAKDLYEFKEKEIMAYALYRHIIKNKYPFSPYDIKFVFNLKSINLLFKIQTLLGDELESDVSAYLIKYLIPLSLSYKEDVEIQYVCNHISSDLHPKSLALLAVFVFCIVRKGMTEKEILRLLKTNKVSNCNIRSIVRKQTDLFNTLRESFTISKRI